jgi:sporulation protein YlmC with PRC-barrel domain
MVHVAGVLIVASEMQRSPMQLSIHAEIMCADGTCGRSTAILMNPISNQVTHLVVREPGLLGVERMAPIEIVTESTSERIQLRCTQAELAEMPPFLRTSYLPALGSSLAPYEGGMMLWPYVGMQSDVVVDHENTPPDELAVHRGSHAHAADGHIGQVEEFVINPTNNGISHVVLREGHFWNREEVTIPVSQIDRIDNDTVYLKLTKREIEALPALALERHAV